MVTNNSCDYSPTQYNLQTGGANGTLNNVAPSATSGVPVISQGSSSQPIFGTAVVAGGGTGVTSNTAYAVLCGGTTSTGAIQSIAGVGTSGQVLTSNGAGALPTFQAASGGSGFTSVVTQVFTGNGTYTPTANMKYCIIEVCGGGGGGGGTTNTGGSQISVASGGAGGGYSRKTVAAATIGASQTVTVGAGGTAGTTGGGTGGTGGTTSVGAIISATGGVGGTGSGAGTTAANAGSAGGTGSSGDFNCTGNGGIGGGAWFISTLTPGFAGAGGGSYFGGAAPTPAQNAAANSGTNYGGGGSGTFITPSQSGRVGGTGSGGIVIITEFI